MAITPKPPVIPHLSITTNTKLTTWYGAIVTISLHWCLKHWLASQVFERKKWTHNLLSLGEWKGFPHVPKWHLKLSGKQLPSVTFSSQFHEPHLYQQIQKLYYTGWLWFKYHNHHSEHLFQTENPIHNNRFITYTILQSKPSITVN